MDNSNIHKLGDTGSITHFFDRSDVRGDPDTGLFKIHIKRFGLDQVVEAETPYHVRLCASRCLAQYLGYDISAYNKILFPKSDESEQLADDDIHGADIDLGLGKPNWGARNDD